MYADGADPFSDASPPELVTSQHVGWSAKKLKESAPSEFIASNTLVLSDIGDPVARATSVADGINEYLTNACSTSIPLR